MARTGWWWVPKLGGRRGEIVESTAFGRTLAGVLFAAGGCAALQADFLAVWRRCAVALGWEGLGGADVGFDSDFFRHEGLQMKNRLTYDFKLPGGVEVAQV